MNPSQPKKIAETLFPALVRAVVVFPDSVKISVGHGSASSIVTVTPDESEAGNCIGRNGRIVKAFILLSKLVSARHDHTITYAVDTPPGDNPPNKDRGRIDASHWNSAACDGLLESTLSAYLFHPAEVNKLVDTKRRTAYEVVLNPSEPEPASISMDGKDKKPLFGDEAVAEALTVIFDAVGRIHGRVLQVAYVRKEAAPEPQPTRADGRYVKELGK